MKNLKQYILENNVDYLDLAHKWVEYGEYDLDEYIKYEEKNKDKDAEELGLTDGEYHFLLDWCKWLEDEKNVKTYSFWIDGPHADSSASDSWFDAIDYLNGFIYRSAHE